ncbi:hypothetical protein VCHE16_2198 [Vibrio paracholerae HE-16]|nr:hypothetical protein VCHE16_2198 [Vibrio paracholerae HE-16]EMP92677.1 hypothetical protein VC87395_001886 [Vibrio paracholerae 87395]
MGKAKTHLTCLGETCQSVFLLVIVDLSPVDLKLQRCWLRSLTPIT